MKLNTSKLFSWGGTIGVVVLMFVFGAVAVGWPNVRAQSVDTAAGTSSAPFITLQSPLSPSSVSSSSLPADTPETVRYRLWYAPADKMAQWPWTDETYFYMDRADFEKWSLRFRTPETEIEINTEIDTETTSSSSVEPSPLDFIRLEATMENQQLVDGQGVIGVRSVHHRFSTEETEKTVVRLHPWNIAMSGLRWSTENEPSFHTTSDGGILMYCDGKGQLNFRWSLRGNQDTNRQLFFDIQLPPCPAGELVLWLDKGLSPRPSSGIALSGTLRNNKVRWQIPLSGVGLNRLVIVSDTETAKMDNRPAVHQSLNYDVTPQGLDVHSLVLLAFAPDRNRELFFELDKPLTISQVLQGQIPLEWNIVENDSVSGGTSGSIPNGTNDTTRIVVRLRENTNDDLNEIQISAQMPLRWNTDWQLPRLRVLTGNVFWIETKATVAVQPPLVTYQLRPTGAVQTFPVERPNRDVYTFQYFVDDASLQIFLGERPSTVHWQTGTVVQWSAGETAATVTADFTTSDPSVFQLEIPLFPHWSVQSIESVPSNQILYWNIKEENRVPQLSVMLRSPVLTDTPLRLKIAARYVGSSPPRCLGDLLPLPIQNQFQQKHILAINPGTASRLVLGFTPNQEPVVTTNSLDIAVRSRFAEVLPATATIIPVMETLLGTELSLEPIRQRYTVDISGQVRPMTDGFTQTYKFLCTPTRQGVDRVYVQLTSPLELPDRTAENSVNTANVADMADIRENEVEEWAWMYGTDTMIPPAARYVPVSQRSELGFSSIGELWEVTLIPPRNSPFELIATKHVPYRQQQPRSVVLAAVPDAANSSAEIVVFSSSETKTQMLVKGVAALPPPAPIPTDIQTVRTIFRYEPLRDVCGIGEIPTIHLIPETTPLPSQSTAWAWVHDLGCLYEQDGLVRVRAQFYIENRGKETLSITLPTGVHSSDIHSVWVDDRRTTWHQGFTQTADDSELADTNTNSRNVVVSELVTNHCSVRVILPEHRRFVSVMVEYSMREKPLLNRKRILPEFPDADIPTLAGTWRVWVPPAYSLLEPESSAQSTVYDRIVSRLLLQKPGGVAATPVTVYPPINPLSAVDWLHIFNPRYQKTGASVQARQFLAALGDETILTTIAAAKVGMTLPTRTGSTDSSADIGTTSSNDVTIRVVSSSMTPSSMTPLGTSSSGSLHSWQEFPLPFESLRQLIGSGTDISNETGTDSSSLSILPGDMAELTLAREQLTWKDILENPLFLEAAFTSEYSTGDVQVFVDYAALTRAGLTPTSTIPLVRTVDTTASGLSKLETAGVAVLFLNNRRIILTSVFVAALHREELEPLAGDKTWFIQEGPFQDWCQRQFHYQPTDSDTEGGTHFLLPLSRWIRMTPPQMRPWIASPLATRLTSLAPGWTARMLNASEANRGLYVQYRNSLLAYRWLSLLFVVVVLTRIPRVRLSFLIFCLAVSGVGMLFLPTIYYEIACGSSWGIMATIGFVMLGIQPHAPKPVLKGRIIRKVSEP